MAQSFEGALDQQIVFWDGKSAYDTVLSMDGNTLTSVNQIYLPTISGGAYMSGTATGILTAAQVDGMFAAPVQLVAGPTNANSLIIPQKFTMGPVATAFTGGGTLSLSWGSGGQTITGWTALSSSCLTNTNELLISPTPTGQTLSSVSTQVGLGIFLTNGTGAFVGGSPAPWSLEYVVIPNA